MTKEDRNRADARFNKANLAKPGKSDRDVATKAVLDNMARLKALRLAREASEPPPAAVQMRGQRQRRFPVIADHRQRAPAAFENRCA